MFSVFGYFEPYFPSASLMAKVERNLGGEGTAEGVVIRNPLRSETARRLRVSLFRAAAEERRLLGFACLPRCSRLGTPGVSPNPR